MGVQLTAAALILLGCALGLRWQAGAWRARPPAWVVLLDVAPLLLGALLFAEFTARPLLGALIVAALAVGLAAANAVKRCVLREPVVFADRAELIELLRHPQFYLPFAGTGAVLACGAATAALAGFAAWAVPPLWPWSPWPALGAAFLVAAALHLPGWPPLLVRLRRLYEGLAPSRDPARDSARWGMLACLIIHATLARAERPVRRAAPPVLRSPPVPGSPAVLRAGRRRGSGPVVMAQIESFFDPRRLHPSLRADLLPGLDGCRGAAGGLGPHALPGRGANTGRTEFTALTGLGAGTLGLDCFNPYERFARTPRPDALAWRARALGCRAFCLHPVDKRFYGRDRAIPALGFERFIGPEAFPREARAEGFVSDAALARKAAEIVADEGPDLFLFAISIGNHGPWLTERGSEDRPPLPDAMRDLPEAASLQRFLGGLRRSDAFFPAMTAGLRAAAPPGGASVLLAYGDHQPSLPKLFAALDHRDTDTDYVLWRSDTEAVASRRQPRPGSLAVEDLPQLVLDCLGGVADAAEIAA